MAAVLCAMMGVRLAAQAPETLVPPLAEASTEQGKVVGVYLRPRWESILPPVTEFKATPEMVDKLVHQLAVLARNFPNEKRVTLELRARALALALQLRPEDRDCVVANGQLSRGVLPRALATERSLSSTEVALNLLKIAGDLAKLNSEPDRQLALYVLDLATALDRSNEKVLSALRGEDPPPDWKRFLEAPQPEPNFAEEEAFDLQAVRSAIKVLGKGSDGQLQFVEFSATAERLPPGPRKPMQLFLPDGIRKACEPELPALRGLMQRRHPHWPTGWRMEVSVKGRPALPSATLPLGIALLLEALVTGQNYSPTAFPACGLDPVTGRISKIHSLPGILAKLPAEGVEVVVIAPENTTEIADLLVLSPERIVDLARFPLCAAQNFQEVVALCRKNRPPLLQRSMEEFRSLVAGISKSGAAYLRQASTIESLENILSINDANISARFLLAFAKKELPGTLSSRASLNLLRDLGHAIYNAGSEEFPFTRPGSTLKETPFLRARLAIERQRGILSAEARGMAEALITLGKLYDGRAMNPPNTDPGMAAWRQQVNQAKRALANATDLLEAKLALPKPATSKPAASKP